MSIIAPLESEEFVVVGVTCDDDGVGLPVIADAGDPRLATSKKVASNVPAYCFFMFVFPLLVF